MNRRMRVFAAVAAVTLMGCSDIFRSSYDYARVVVTVSDEQGLAVPGVRLTLYTGTRHMSYGVTTADGSYTFAFVPAGGYGIEAGVPPGYGWPAGALPYRIVDVVQGGAYTVTFELEAQP